MGEGDQVAFDDPRRREGALEPSGPALLEGLALGVAGQQPQATRLRDSDSTGAQQDTGCP